MSNFSDRLDGLKSRLSSFSESDEQTSVEEKIQELSEQISELRSHYIDVDEDKLEAIKEILLKEVSNSSDAIATENIIRILTNDCEKCPNCPNDKRGVVLSNEQFLQLLAFVNKSNS